MTLNRPFTAEQADLGEGMSMVVVERPTKRSFSSIEIKTSDAAQRELAKSWRRTLGLIGDEENLVAYTPDLVMRAGDPRVAVMPGNLSQESEIVADLLADVDRPPEAPSDVAKAGNLYLYALISDTDAGRVTMIKKRTPAKQAREGKWWALAEKELRLIEEDPWQIFPSFDLVVTETGTYVCNLVALDQLLGDSAILTERVGDWVSGIAAALPIPRGQEKILIERCEESSRLRQRLRAINSRGHLKRVGIDQVRAHAQRMKLRPEDFIENGELVISDTNVDQLLKLLNEDLFTGGLTGDPFVSGGKEPFH